MLDHIYLDIETLPCQKPEFLGELLEEANSDANNKIALLSPPKTLKKQETIDEWMATEYPQRVEAIRAEAEASAEEKYRNTSFDGAFGKIAVIGYAVNNQDPVSLWRPEYETDEAERTIIAQFYMAMNDLLTESRGKLPNFVGQNIVGFDFRFMFQRSVIHRIQPPAAIPFHAKPWDDRVFDTMTKWAGDRNRASLSKICEALGVQGKGEEIGEEIDGSMVWDFVKAGRIEDVAKYCEGDVVRVREIHKRLTFTN